MLVMCEVCEREFALEDAVLWDDDGDLHYFCSEACYEEAAEATPVQAGWEDDEAL